MPFLLAPLPRESTRTALVRASSVRASLRSAVTQGTPHASLSLDHRATWICSENLRPSRERKESPQQSKPNPLLALSPLLWRPNKVQKEPSYLWLCAFLGRVPPRFLPNHCVSRVSFKVSPPPGSLLWFLTWAKTPFCVLPLTPSPSHALFLSLIWSPVTAREGRQTSNFLKVVASCCSSLSVQGAHTAQCIEVTGEFLSAQP